MPRRKPITREGIDTLNAALQQGGWRAEIWYKSFWKVTAAINGFSIIPLNTGRILLSLSVEGRKEFRQEIREVGIHGEFGSSLEPRNFFVTFRNLSERYRKQAQDRTAFVRHLSEGYGIRFVRDKDAPPGWPVPAAYQNRTYTLAEYKRRCGTGANVLRTGSFAQPFALRVGDKLATGEVVLSPI